MANAHAWYEDAYNVSAECQGNGVGCDGWDAESDADCDCYCHSDVAPFFETNEDVAEWHGDDRRATALINQSEP